MPELACTDVDVGERRPPETRLKDSEPPWEAEEASALARERRSPSTPEAEGVGVRDGLSVDMRSASGK